MTIQTRLLALACVLAIPACDTPTTLEVASRRATLVGDLIETRVGEWFNIEELLPKPLKSATYDGSFSFRLSDFANVRCDAPGWASLLAEFTDETSQSYRIYCVGQITGQLDQPFNLDVLLGRDVQYIVQSSGLITSSDASGDVVITCTSEGQGTLWVFFRDLGTDYYDLTCMGHDQGASG